MRFHTDYCCDFNTGRPSNDFNCICQYKEPRNLMCKPLDLDRPLRLRDCIDGVRRPVEVLVKQFNLTSIRDGVLVQVVTPDGDGLGVYDVNDGSILWRNCTGLAGTTLENVPQKKKFYLYEVRRVGKLPEVSHSMRAEPVKWMTIGRTTFKLLKEVEVEL